MLKGWLLSIILLLPISLASASPSIKTQVAANEDGLFITSTNIGSDSAFNVILEVDGPVAKTVKVLEPGNSISFSTSDVLSNGKLESPVLIRTRYQDAEGNSLTAVSLNVGGNPNGEIVIAATKKEEVGRKGVEVYLHNARGKEREVTVSLMQPETSKKKILLGEKEEEKILFELSKKKSIKDTVYSYFRIPV